MEYYFRHELIEGVIRARPNRFVMMVDCAGVIFRCRCPAPTKIGNLIFENVPCLLSLNRSNATTTHTVEAIYVYKNETVGFWVGINQTKINSIVLDFIMVGAMSRLIKPMVLERDKDYGHSRIDLAGSDFLLEIKMPLTVLPTEAQASSISNYNHNGDYSRTMRHYKILAKYACRGKRTVVLLVYMYSAPRFNILMQNGNNIKFIKTVKSVKRRGVEFWQANFEIDKNSVKLSKYFKLK